MQAHSVRAAEAQRVQVVKVVVEQSSQRAALLLADASCLLVKLASPAAAPISVPAPCTDACFLRLQAYGPAGASATSKPGASSITPLTPSASRLNLGDAVAGGGKPAQGNSCTPSLEMGQTSKAPELREKLVSKFDSGSGKVTGQGLAAVRNELYVVTARPGKGGSCTDLRAWCCAGSAFTRVNMEVEPGRRRIRAIDSLKELQSGGVFARLEAPHGLTVKIAASINVLVVYSSSAGKIWVMSGKSLEHKVESTRTLRPAGVSESKQECIELGAEEGRRRGLLLIKCAVVGCYGPVYSLHVSTLHLFLGENKGVRVWSLRPLIKPRSSGKNNRQAKLRNVGPEQSSRLSSGNLDRDTAQPNKHCLYHKEAGKVHEKKIFGNGIHLEERSGALKINESFQNVKVEESVGGLPMKKEARKVLYSREQFIGANSLHSGIFAIRSLSELQAALSVESGQGGAGDLSGKTIMQHGGGGVIKNETQNGIIRSHLADHGDISSKEDMPSGAEPCVNAQVDFVTSTNSDLFPFDKSNGRISLLKTIPRQRNGILPITEFQLKNHDDTSYMTNQKTFHQTGAPVPTTCSSALNRKDGRESGISGPVFIALTIGNEDVNTLQLSSTASTVPPVQIQVLDIQGLNRKEYIVLDSKGGLHLLTLQELPEDPKCEDIHRLQLTIRHLRSSMQVSCFAVLPLPPLPQVQQVVFPPTAATVKRKIWISDGMYSIHVVNIPDVGSNANNDSAAMESTLAVSQAVFAKEQVEGLVAGSPDSVLVLMKGRVLAYVMAQG